MAEDELEGWIYGFAFEGKLGIMMACHSSIILLPPRNSAKSLCAFPRTVTHRGGGFTYIGVTMPFVKGDPRLMGNKFGKQFYKGQFDELQPNWKGDDVSYAGLHKWLGRRKGKAPRLCEQCGRVARCHWANISGEYKRDLSDYRALCASCHKYEDYARVYGNTCKRGHEYTPENTHILKNGQRRCRICARDNARRRNGFKGKPYKLQPVCQKRFVQPQFMDRVKLLRRSAQLQNVKDGT